LRLTLARFVLAVLLVAAATACTDAPVAVPHHCAVFDQVAVEGAVGTLSRAPSLTNIARSGEPDLIVCEYVGKRGVAHVRAAPGRAEFDQFVREFGPVSIQGPCDEQVWRYASLGAVCGDYTVLVTLFIRDDASILEEPAMRRAAELLLESLRAGD
jgi:hypothetical protein